MEETQKSLTSGIHSLGWALGRQYDSDSDDELVAMVQDLRLKRKGKVSVVKIIEPIEDVIPTKSWLKTAIENLPNQYEENYRSVAGKIQKNKKQKSVFQMMKEIKIIRRGRVPFQLDEYMMRALDRIEYLETIMGGIKDRNSRKWLKLRK